MFLEEAMEQKLEVPFGVKGWNEINKGLGGYRGKEDRESLEGALIDYVFDEITKKYGETKAVSIWDKEKIDWYIKEELLPLVLHFVKQQKVPKKLVIDLSRDWSKEEAMQKRALRENVGRLRKLVEKEKWIQKVSQEAEEKGTKGAFRKWCEKRGYTKVTQECIREAKKVARETGNTKLMRRAVAAENMIKAGD
jgi:hypothetical protein